nr:EEIG1/EHBP1 N-terminal domain-containing protein [Tanacetum cinerariifolium]
MKRKERIPSLCRKVLLDDFEAIGKGKNKVTFDALEGKCKDKVLLDDSNDGLISTKGDGEQTNVWYNHYKVLLNDSYAKDIKVGSALILRNVSMFCPKSSNYALNITLRNLVKIFQKYTVVEDADGASGSNI